jgi:type I restriction enzyme S subunit
MKDGWKMVPLGELLARSDETVEIVPTEQYKEVTIRLWGKGVVLRGEVQGQDVVATRRFGVNAGQFILSRIDARNGAFGIVPGFLDGAVASNDFPVYNIAESRLLTAYLGWMSKTRQFVDFCRAASEGTTNRVRLQEERFLATSIPLPPLSEQRRIVAKVEELAAKIEEARGLRNTTDNEATYLLSSARFSLFAPAHNWKDVALGEVADIRSGVTLGRDLYGSTIEMPYLRVANVQDGHLDLGIMKTVTILESEKDKWLLASGDILLTEGGDWDKLGRGTVWMGEIPNCIHQNHIFRVRVKPTDFDPFFLSALIGSPYGKAYFQAASKQTTNLASINQRQLRDFLVYKPPLPEQRRIVAYLDDLQAKVDSLKALQAQSTAELDALLPSILDKAFKGEQ